jgi:hypothetical protein
MKNSLKALGLCLVLATNFAYAESPKNDAETMEAVNKFSDESSKMREDHIQQMRELHLKHVNEMYDRKLAHHKEIIEMWKLVKPGDKAGNKAFREKLKEKRDTFEKEDEKFRDDFKRDVLKKKQNEFRDLMKGRHKEMKGKFKD